MNIFESSNLQPKLVKDIKIRVSSRFMHIIYFCCMDEETHPPDEFMRCFGNQPHDFHLVGATMNIKPLNNGGRSSPPDV